MCSLGLPEAGAVQAPALVNVRGRAPLPCDASRPATSIPALGTCSPSPSARSPLWTFSDSPPADPALLALPRLRPTCPSHSRVQDSPERANRRARSPALALPFLRGESHPTLRLSRAKQRAVPSRGPLCCHCHLRAFPYCAHPPCPGVSQLGPATCPLRMHPGPPRRLGRVPAESQVWPPLCFPVDLQTWGRSSPSGQGQHSAWSV